MSVYYGYVAWNADKTTAVKSRPRPLKKYYIMYVCLAVCPIGRGEMGCGGSKHSMFDGAPLISVHELLASPPAQGIVPGYHRPRLARGGRDRAGHGSERGNIQYN